MDRPLSASPVDLLDDRGHLLAAERLPLPRALRGEEVTGHVVRFVRRDGSLLWVEVHANPLHHDDGQLYGRSRPMTTSRRGSSRTGARATRPTPTR